MCYLYFYNHFHAYDKAYFSQMDMKLTTNTMTLSISQINLANISNLQTTYIPNWGPHAQQSHLLKLQNIPIRLIRYKLFSSEFLYKPSDRCKSRCSLGHPCPTLYAIISGEMSYRSRIQDNLNSNCLEAQTIYGYFIKVALIWVILSWQQRKFPAFI